MFFLPYAYHVGVFCFFLLFLLLFVFVFLVLHLKKNLNAPKPSSQSKGLDENIGCRDKYSTCYKTMSYGAEIQDS